jgi:hypothetical protein
VSLTIESPPANEVGIFHYPFGSSEFRTSVPQSLLPLGPVLVVLLAVELSRLLERLLLVRIIIVDHFLAFGSIISFHAHFIYIF